MSSWHRTLWHLLSYADRPVLSISVRSDRKPRVKSRLGIFPINHLRNPSDHPPHLVNPSVEYIHQCRNLVG